MPASFTASSESAVRIDGAARSRSFRLSSPVRLKSKHSVAASAVRDGKAPQDRLIQ